MPCFFIKHNRRGSLSSLAMLSRLVFWMQAKEANSCLVICSLRCDPLKTPTLTCSKMGTFHTTKAVGNGGMETEARNFGGKRVLKEVAGRPSTDDASSCSDGGQEPTDQSCSSTFILPTQAFMSNMFAIEGQRGVGNLPDLRHSAHTHNPHQVQHFVDNSAAQ